MLLIRDALIQDSEVICSAEKKIAETPGHLVSSPEELKPDSFRRKIEFLSRIENGRFILAEEGGVVVGHALLDPMGLKSIEHVVRLTIAVHIGHQGKGVGKALLSELIEWAKANPKILKIELNVRSGNDRAIRLYQSLGIQIEGRIRERVKLAPDRFVDDLEMGLFVKDLKNYQAFTQPGEILTIGDTLIRKGKWGDEAELTSCHTHAWQQSYRGIVPDKVLDSRPLSFRSRMKWWTALVRGETTDSVVVAESANFGIVGFCAFGPARDKDFEGMGEVTAIYCLNEFKGKGVGKALFLSAQKELKTQGFSSMYLWVLKDNPTIHFYQKMGGVRMNEEKTIDLGAPLKEFGFKWELR